MVRHAHKLAPTLAARAEECEKLRRLPDSTERDLHDAGLFRFVQPASAWAARSSMSASSSMSARRWRGSARRRRGTSATSRAITGCWATSRCETQEELWDVSLDVLIATSLAFAGGRGRKVDGGWEVTGRWPLSSGVDNSDWNMLGFMVRDSENGPVVDQRFALAHRSEYEIIDTWHAVGLCGTGIEGRRGQGVVRARAAHALGLGVQRQAAS